MRGGLRRGGGLLRASAAVEHGAGRNALKLLADQTGAKSRIAALAGAGVEHDAAAARLKEIAERWSIPVATTLRAKGVFPEDHPLSLGVFGYAGTRHATAAILGGELDCRGLALMAASHSRRCAAPAVRAGFARALGAQGFTVRDPAQLETTFQQALAAGTTALVDVKADKNCPTPVYDFSAGARAWSYHE
jgi:thiamine pyrophosphate-dependent acetolactate synthase large subunit-like protein